MNPTSPGERPLPGGVGRSRELATAALAREAARAGGGGALAVTGGPGIGKTWLCEAIAANAIAEGFRVGWGAAWSTGTAPPLWPWRQATAELDAAAAALFDEPPELDGAEWFARSAAVVDALRQVSTDQPCMVVLDDVHAADLSTARLAHFVARHVRGLKFVLVVAHEPSPMLEAFDRDATEIALHGLDPDHVASMLASAGFVELSEHDVAFVTRCTGGRPIDVRRLATSSDRARGVVRSLIEERIASLPADVVHASACAAMLGAAPHLREVDELTAGAVDVRAMASDLDRLGLARPTSSETIAFAHECVRESLVATLAPDELVALDARAARLLEEATPTVDRLQRRATHALAALRQSSARDEARAAVELAEQAAAALIAANDPEPAAALLADAEAAYDTARLGSPPASLLTAHAAAVLRCGWLANASALYGLAATAAEDEGDAVSFGAAALGMGGVWLAEQRSPIDRERVLGLQRRARDGLPDSEPVLQMRLDARLAAEEAYEFGRSERIEAQVAAARAFGDPAVLAETLSLYHHTLLGPVHRDLREQIAREMISVTAEIDDNALSLMAQLWLTTNQFLAGVDHAERSLGDLHARADALAGRHAAYIASVMDVMLLQRAGRLEDAERAAHAAFEVGVEIGDADAIAYYGVQVVVLRWIEGRSEEVVELTAATAASPTITPANHAFTGVFATLAAECGEHDRAYAALTRVRGQLATIPQNSAWLATMFTIIEAAYAIGDADIAAEAAELLAPYADLPVLGSLAVVCLGSARRALGLAAIATGAVDDGITLLEAAVADNHRLGNRPLAALTMAALARVRAGRGREDDVDVARALFDRAIREAEAMGLSIRADAWRNEQAAIVDRADSPAPTVVDDDFGAIERHGSSWMLGAGGKQIVVPDLLGMSYLSRLLMNPGVEIAAAALVIDAGDTSAALAVRDEQPVLDETALAAYRRRVADLEEDIAEAEGFGDSERAERARMELDAVVDELARTTNRFGRARPFASSNERARTAVQKAVRRVLDHIDTVDADLGSALRQSVRTGRTCSYQPVPGLPKRWRATTSD